MKITINGNVAVVTTTITPEQMNIVLKQAPELLVIKDDKENDLYSVSIGNGTIGQVGAEFAVTFGKLTATVNIPAELTDEGVDKFKAWLFDKLGLPKKHIEAIEDRVAQNINGLEVAAAAFMNEIEVM